MYYIKKNNKNHLLGNKFRVGKFPWNKGKKGVQIISDKTKAKLRELSKGNQNAKGYKHTDEWKKKAGERQRGKRHYNWKGGKSRDKHTTFQYRQWRSDVFQRDNWVCQTCGERGIYLEAHHIKSWSQYPKLRYELNNGVALCKECHKLTDNYKGRNNGLLHNNGDKKNSQTDG